MADKAITIDGELVFLASGGGGGGSSTFVGLTDTPSSLSGQGGKQVAVNSGGTALEFTVGVKRVVSTYTANQTLDADDDMVICTTNAFTVTLPTAASITGKVYDIKNSAANTGNLITVDGNGTETIDGSLTYSVVAGNSLKIVSDGTNWHII